MKHRLAILVALVLGSGGALVEGQTTADQQLVRALESADLAAAAKAIDVGANPNATFDDGYPLIAMAAIGEDAKGVEFLLRSGASPNSTADNGSTALMIAAKWGREKTVRVLLENGASAELRDKKGADALFYAVKNGHTEIETLLSLALKSRKK